MKKWPLNSTTLFAATQSKLRKAADGIGIPVATCMINKWTTKINEKEIYNGKFPPRARGEKEREKGRKTVAVPTTPESFHRLAPKNRGEGESVLGQSPRIYFYPSSRWFDHPISLWSCPTVRALTKAQFLSQFSLPNLLYRVRWVWAHLPNSKEPPKSGPYNIYWCNK